MKLLRAFLLGLGVTLTLVGLLWIGQGLGYINRPASRFMLARVEWADRGAAVAVAGLLLLLVARRLPRRR